MNLHLGGLTGTTLELGYAGAYTGGPAFQTVPVTVYPSESIVLGVTAAGAVQGTGSVTIGGVAQTVTAWSDTSITITGVLGVNSYGTGKTLVLTTDSATTATDTIQIVANTAGAFGYVDIANPNTTDESSVAFNATPTVVTGDQFEWEDFNALGNLVIDAQGFVSSVDAQGTFRGRFWDSTDSSWGSVANFTVVGTAVVAGDSLVSVTSNATMLYTNVAVNRSITGYALVSAVSNATMLYTDVVFVAYTQRKGSTFNATHGIGTITTATLNSIAITINTTGTGTVNLTDTSGITTSGAYDLVLGDGAATETYTVQLNVIGLPVYTLNKDGAALGSLTGIKLLVTATGELDGTQLYSANNLTATAGVMDSRIFLDTGAVADVVTVSILTSAGNGITISDALEQF
jgi:hypothetical protein